MPSSVADRLARPAPCAILGLVVHAKPVKTVPEVGHGQQRLFREERAAEEQISPQGKRPRIAGQAPSGSAFAPLGPNHVGSGMPLSIWSRFSTVAPLVSKWKFDGRCCETGSLKLSNPFSDSLMTSAAMTVFVKLAMPNWERASTGCSPSAVPAAPVHAPPPAANTVAVIPGSPPGSIAALRMA